MGVWRGSLGRFGRRAARSAALVAPMSRWGSAGRYFCLRASTPPAQSCCGCDLATQTSKRSTAANGDGPPGLAPCAGTATPMCRCVLALLQVSEGRGRPHTPLLGPLNAGALEARSPTLAQQSHGRCAACASLSCASRRPQPHQQRRRRRRRHRRRRCRLATPLPQKPPVSWLIKLIRLFSQPFKCLTRCLTRTDELGRALRNLFFGTLVLAALTYSKGRYGLAAIYTVCCVLMIVNPM